MSILQSSCKFNVIHPHKGPHEMLFTVRCHQTYYRVFGKLSCGFCVCACVCVFAVCFVLFCCDLKKKQCERERHYVAEFT